MSALMDFLLRNANNKRVMTILRCGLVEDTEMRAWPLLAPLDGIGARQQARAIRTVAGLFALHPRNCASGNMGTVCRLLCRNGNPGGNDTETGSPDPMERRFLHLLNADREEICGRVCRLVRYAGSNDIPVNYAALEKDLSEWPRARESWAAAFWAPMADARAEAEGAAS